MQSSDEGYYNPAVGQRVLVEGNDIPPGMADVPATVVSIDTTDSALPVFAELANGQRWWCAGWSPFVETDLLEPKMIPVSDHDRTVEVLNAQISELAAERDRLRREEERQRNRANTLQTHYDHDLTWIDDHMLQTVKVNQSWCDSGYNEVIENVNNNITGGFQFTLARRLVEKRVMIKGETTYEATVHVYEDDDVTDSDNWMDADGEQLDADEFMQEELKAEFSRCHGFDTVEVA